MHMLKKTLFFLSLFLLISQKIVSGGSEVQLPVGKKAKDLFYSSKVTFSKHKDLLKNLSQVVDATKKSLSEKSPFLNVCRLKTKFPMHMYKYTDKEGKLLVCDVHNPVKTYIFAECRICRNDPKYLPLLPCCKKSICKSCYDKIYDCPFCRKNLKQKPQPQSVILTGQQIAEIAHQIIALSITAGNSPEQAAQ